MDHHTVAADDQTARPAKRGYESRCARSRMLDPSPEDCRRNAKHGYEGLENVRDVRDRPVAILCGQFGDEAAVTRGGAGDELAHRQPEHAEAIRHADAQMDGKRCRRYEPAIEGW